jgi:Prokaryotic cytochrome b561
MAIQTDLPDIVFAGHGALPADFWIFPVRTVHYLFSRLLMALIALHVAGALYHTFILKDGLLRRMFFGRRVFATSDPVSTPSRPLPQPWISWFAPWLNRFVLFAAALALAMIGRKFITDPVGAATASNMTLGSALAVTNMRASFGAFPLG